MKTFKNPSFAPPPFFFLTYIYIYVLVGAADSFPICVHVSVHILYDIPLKHMQKAIRVRVSFVYFLHPNKKVDFILAIHGSVFDLSIFT